MIVTSNNADNDINNSNNIDNNDDNNNNIDNNNDSNKNNNIDNKDDNTNNDIGVCSFAFSFYFWSVLIVYQKCRKVELRLSEFRSKENCVTIY